MIDKKPPRQPAASRPDEPEGTEEQPVAPGQEDRAEADPSSTEVPEGPDLYEDLWDPDMDTRPARIRRTRARARSAASTKGRRRESA